MSSILPGCGVLPAGSTISMISSRLVGVHRAPTMAEDRQALLLAPIVDDMREQIRIATRQARAQRNCPPQS